MGCSIYMLIPLADVNDYYFATLIKQQYITDYDCCMVVIE